MNVQALLKCKLEGTQALLAFRTDVGVTHRARSFEFLFDKYLVDSSEGYLQCFEYGLPKEFVQ